MIAGSVVVIHGNVVHMSEKNESTQSRHVYTFHMVDGKKHWSEENWYLLKYPFFFSKKKFTSFVFSKKKKIGFNFPKTSTFWAFKICEIFQSSSFLEKKMTQTLSFFFK